LKPLTGSLITHLTFKRPIIEPLSLFKNFKRISVFFLPIGKRNSKPKRGIRINTTNTKKRDQSAKTLAGLERSNEIQKECPYPASLL